MKRQARAPERILPHSIEAETAALVAAFQDADAARKVAELPLTYFYDDHRREILSSIQSVLTHGEPVNVLTVYHELQTRGGLAKEIPATALHDLEAAGPAVGYLPTTLACLRKEARRRMLIEAGSRLVERTRENGRDEAELLGEFWEATKSLDVAGPVPMAVIREGDDFRYSQDSLGVEVQISRVREAGEGIQGELTVSLNGRALHWGRASLGSLSGREALVTKLRRSSARIPWADILEQVCRSTAETLRASEPTVQLVPGYRSIEPYVIEKLVPERETSVLFGDGGTGKSLVGKSISLAIATKTRLPSGLIPWRAGPVLTLDWEGSKEEHEHCLARLMAGLGLSGPVPIHYRRMTGALADDLPAIRADVARLAPVLVIVDSLGPACGLEPESADAAIRTLNALRSVSPAKLVIAHVSKVMADQRGAARPFGSVFVQNLPRNVWELRKGEDEEVEDLLTVGIYHRKSNLGRLSSPFGLQFEFAEKTIQIRDAEVAQDAKLRERAGLTYSIRAALRSGGQTIADLAEALEAKEDTVQKAMYRLEKAGVVVRLDDIRPAPGKAIRWGLKA